jgi:hypothetical protein
LKSRRFVEELNQNVMGSISFQILNEKDIEMVMGVLKAFADNNVIRILDEGDNDSIALPGPPLTDEQWIKYIENAESEPSVSGEEMRVIFKYLRMTSKSKPAV